MQTDHNTLRLILAACGATAGLSSLAHGQATNINISGATLFQAFFTAPASTNDYLDVDGNGVARSLGSNQQLAPFILPPDTTAHVQPWVVQYRAVGSGNGLAEMVSFGTTFATAPNGTSAPEAQMNSSNLENAWYNRTKWFDLATGLQGTANTGNPGAAPVRADMTTLVSQYAAPNSPAAGGIRIDLAIMDVPTRWFVTQAGTPGYALTPGVGGYGLNPRRSVNPQGSTAGANQSNTLKSLGSLNLFNPPTVPNANTVFDTPIAFAPICVMTNFGTGMQQITIAELQHLSTTGRLPSGENLIFVTRDSGSGTRNGFMNSICVDPSWGVGDNVGIKNDTPAQNILGPNWLPNNKGGSGGLENTVINTRLAIGYTGAERGVSQAWLTGNPKAEILAVKRDGDTQYTRPTIDALLDNGVINSYTIGGPETFASIGDARRFDAIGGDAGNTNPAMRNPQAAAYLNNITRSIAAFVDQPGGSDTLFTPGEYLASQFILVSATDTVPDPASPCSRIANPSFNQALQDFTRTHSVYQNAAYPAFNTAGIGLVPARTNPVAPYTDGVANGSNYIDQAGNVVAYGSSLTLRNKICGDFNGDGLRDRNDASNLVAAYRQRNGGPAWSAPTGTGTIAGAPGSNAVIEILGDFNGDGNFDKTDVRTWADGLGVDPTTRNLDRKAAFVAIDTAFGGNLLGATLATGKPYNAGDSRGDIIGTSGNVARGFAAVGSDNVVDAYDIDYVYKQFKQNASVTDGEANWNNLLEAISFDLSADMNGDMAVNQCDVDELVVTILGTNYGDVNLSGQVQLCDIQTIQANLNTNGGWAQGDMNGDGVVNATDLSIARCHAVMPGTTTACPPGNLNGPAAAPAGVAAYVSIWFASVNAGDLKGDFDCNGSVTPSDVAAFVSLWFDVVQNGC